jgi:hypothetical protein
VITCANPDVGNTAAEPVSALYKYLRTSSKQQEDGLIAGYAQANADNLLEACNQMIQCLAGFDIDIEPYKRLASSAYTFWMGPTVSNDTEADLKRLFSPGIEALYNLKRALMIEIANSQSSKPTTVGMER